MKDVDRALGTLVRAWSIAQKWYIIGNRMIPEAEWAKQGIDELIFEVGLAERIDGHVRIAGSDEQFHWLLQRVEAGRKGGHAKASGRLAGAKRELAGAKPLSLSLSQDSNTPLPPTRPRVRDHFGDRMKAGVGEQEVRARVLDKYPYPRGWARAWPHICAYLASSEDKDLALANLEAAAVNYTAEMKRLKRAEGKIKAFDNWIIDGHWRDFIAPVKGADFSEGDWMAKAQAVSDCLCIADWTKAWDVVEGKLGPELMDAVVKIGAYKMREIKGNRVPIIAGMIREYLQKQRA